MKKAERDIAYKARGSVTRYSSWALEPKCTHSGLVWCVIKTTRSTILSGYVGASPHIYRPNTEIVVRARVRPILAALTSAIYCRRRSLRTL